MILTGVAAPKLLVRVDRPCRSRLGTLTVMATLSVLRRRAGPLVARRLTATCLRPLPAMS